MADTYSPFNDEQSGVLKKLRLIWAAMLLEILVLGALVILIVNRGTAAPVGNRATWFIIAMAVTFGGVLLGFFARMQAYKKHWVGNRITARGYLTGNLLLFGLIEAAALFGLVNLYFARHVGNDVIPVLAAAAFLVLNFPNGRPMLDQEPDLARRS